MTDLVFIDSEEVGASYSSSLVRLLPLVSDDWTNLKDTSIIAPLSDSLMNPLLLYPLFFLFWPLSILANSRKMNDN